MNDLVVIFIIFNHLTKLLFCFLYHFKELLPYYVSEDNRSKSLFLIKFRPAKSVVFIYFYFPTHQPLGFSSDTDLILRKEFFYDDVKFV